MLNLIKSFKNIFSPKLVNNIVNLPKSQEQEEQQGYDYKICVRFTDEQIKVISKQNNKSAHIRNCVENSLNNETIRNKPPLENSNNYSLKDENRVNFELDESTYKKLNEYMEKRKCSNLSACIRHFMQFQMEQKSRTNQTNCLDYK